MVIGALFGFIALIVAIVAIAQLTDLRKRIENLEAALRPADQLTARLSPAPTAPTPAVPPPLPKFVQTPPPMPVTSSRETSPVPDRVAGINWESFVGVRLFAWIGGLALFLGVVFFVKYAFDNNLITPVMRIISGMIAGVALIVIGAWTPARRYRIPAQSLCATAILIFYADVYAAY